MMSTNIKGERKVNVIAVVGFTDKIAFGYEGALAIFPSNKQGAEDAYYARWGNQRIVPCTITYKLPKLK